MIEAGELDAELFVFGVVAPMNCPFGIQLGSHSTGLESRSRTELQHIVAFVSSNTSFIQPASSARELKYWKRAFVHLLANRISRTGLRSLVFCKPRMCTAHSSGSSYSCFCDSSH